MRTRPHTHTVVVTDIATIITVAVIAKIVGVVSRSCNRDGISLSICRGGTGNRSISSRSGSQQ